MISKETRLHTHRTARGYRHHSDSRGDPVSCIRGFNIFPGFNVGTPTTTATVSRRQNAGRNTGYRKQQHTGIEKQRES